MARISFDGLMGGGGDIAHLPGHRGAPLLGHTLQFLGDPLAFARRHSAAYGPVARGNFLFLPRVMCFSADINEQVLLNRDEAFSSERGWSPVLEKLFPRGLMLRDGADHRQHRRLMQPAFRSEALAGYLDLMNPLIASRLDQWQGQPDFHFYPAIKQLTLDMAAQIFLGLVLDAEVSAVNRDFSDLVEASGAVLRMRYLGPSWTCGLSARRRLAQRLAGLIATRRHRPAADLFSQLCLAEDEQGQRYADTEIVDHLIFLMMAAHDTTTSALTTIVYALTQHPVWQQRLAEQALDRSDERPDFEALKGHEETLWVLREALRLYPPLTIMLRETLKPVQLAGHPIPAGTSVALFPVYTQRDPHWWTDPDGFDPARFSPARQEHRRHPFAWAPFGGGVHMCLGLHFAEMQVKAVIHQLLRRFSFAVAPDYEMPYRLAPIAHPLDGLPLKLASRLRGRA